MGRWADGEMGRWGDGEIGRLAEEKVVRLNATWYETVKERCSAVLGRQRGLGEAAPPKGVPPMTDCIKKWYLEVRKVETGKVITVIEILSPKNKRSKAVGHATRS